MNTQQLEYLVEIDRTGSISQAAENLYMGQPNLSRILRDMESSLGYAIFERTRRGVRPTEKGTIFLQHARNILREQTMMRTLGEDGGICARFHICLPRSWVLVDGAVGFLAKAGTGQNLDAAIRECHPKQGLQMLLSGAVQLGILRYCTEYQDYFGEQLSPGQYTITELGRQQLEVVVSEDSPLAALEAVDKETLAAHLEIAHRDPFQSRAGQSGGRVYAVDRMAQVQMLRRIPGAYLWAEHLPEALLREHHLVQRPCGDNTRVYQDVLVRNARSPLSDLEQRYAQMLISISG